MIYDLTEDDLRRYREIYIDASIAAEGAEEAYIHASRNIIRQEMNKKGIRRGSTIIVEGERLVVCEPTTEFETLKPALKCVPFTKKGTPSKIETVDVFIHGIRFATIIKE